MRHQVVGSRANRQTLPTYSLQCEIASYAIVVKQAEVAAVTPDPATAGQGLRGLQLGRVECCVYRPAAICFRNGVGTLDYTMAMRAIQTSLAGQ